MILKLLLNTRIIWVGDIYENIEEYNPGKERKVLIVFEDMIGDLLSDKKIATELLIRGRKLSISLIFITQSYFAISKCNIRLSKNIY